MTASAAAAEAPGASSTSIRAHIPALDGVRGVAILLVLVYHLWGSTFDFTQTRFDDGISRVIGIGFVGVDLFFVLSGFLITGILLDAKGGDGFFSSFYARRFLRIFPLYYGFLFVLIVVFAFWPAVNGDSGLDALRRHQAWLWGYAYNISVSSTTPRDLGAYWVGHLWSLAVEEQFYLVWPFVVFCFSRRNLTVACLCCLAGAPLFRLAAMHGAIPHVSAAFGPTMLMPARVDTLAAGALLAIAARDPALFRVARRCALPLIGAALLTVLTLYARNGHVGELDRDVQGLGYSMIALGFMGVLTLVIAGAQGSMLQSTLVHPALKFLGRYSYGIYIIHGTACTQLGFWTMQHGYARPIGDSYFVTHLMFSIVVGALCIAGAWLSWHIWEQPFLRLKRYFPYDAGARRRPESTPDETAQPSLPQPQTVSVQ